MSKETEAEEIEVEKKRLLDDIGWLFALCSAVDHVRKDVCLAAKTTIMMNKPIKMNKRRRLN